MSHSHTNHAVADASALVHEEISQIAREIWTESGKPDDRDVAIWLEAERRLKSAERAPGILAEVLLPLSATPDSEHPSTTAPVSSPPRRRARR